MLVAVASASEGGGCVSSCWGFVYAISQSSLVALEEATVILKKGLSLSERARSESKTRTK